MDSDVARLKCWLRRGCGTVGNRSGLVCRVLRFGNCGRSKQRRSIPGGRRISGFPCFLDSLFPFLRPLAKRSVLACSLTSLLSAAASLPCSLAKRSVLACSLTSLLSAAASLPCSLAKRSVLACSLTSSPSAAATLPCSLSVPIKRAHFLADIADLPKKQV